MAYAPLDEHFDEHPKYEELELEHFGLMACAIAYCTRNLTDGKVSYAAVRKFGRTMKGVRLAKKLVDLGIWREVDGGWEIVGFLDHNPSRAEVLAKREDARRRKDAYRKSRPGDRPPDVPPPVPMGQPMGRTMGQPVGQHTGQTVGQPMGRTESRARAPAGALHSTPSPLHGTPSPNATPPPLSRGEDAFWTSAYGEAVREALGGSWGFPAKQISGLRSAVEAHCPDRSQTDGWLRETVPRFVRATRTKPEVWSSFGPDGFLRWLNAKCPDETDASGVRPVGGASARARRDLTGFEP